MSELTSPAPAAVAPDAATRGRRWGALGAILVLVPLIGAIVFVGPKVWHTVRSEQTGSIAVPSLPAQQPAASAQIPAEQRPVPGRGQVGDLDRFAARDPFASPLPPPRPQPRKQPATLAAAPVPTAPVAASAAPATAVAGTGAAAPAAVAPATVPRVPGAADLADPLAVAPPVPAAPVAPVAAVAAVAPADSAAAPGVPAAVAPPALVPPAVTVPAMTAAAAVPSAVPPAATSVAPAVAPVPGALTAAATISVNGIPERVGVKGVFPASDPVFRLVALGAGQAQISVADGSTAGGDQTVTLSEGRSVTLLDTSSGARYTLQLVAQPTAP